MLDGFLGRGFSSKCKSLVKPTKARIAVLRKRQDATQKFLKGNLAQLLSNGLDINAYGRTEEFIAGQNVLSCYDFIEQCCEYILKQLSLMQKQRECPEECREPVGSLTFAAARFPDMPELRDLRDLFQERYGTGLEHFVNHEFVEKIASNSPTKEKKLQLLQDIALEFTINWDCRGFQRTMIDPSTFSPNIQDQHKRLNPISDPDKYKLSIDKDKPSNSERKYNSNKEYSHLNHDRNRLHNSSHKSQGSSKQSTPTRDNPVPSNFNGYITSESTRKSSRGKEPDVQDGKQKPFYDRTSGVSLKDRATRDGKDVVSSSSAHNKFGEMNMKEEAYNNAGPPPYMKPRDNPMIPPPYIKPKESKHASSGSDGAFPEKLTNHGHEKGSSHYDDVPLPRDNPMIPPPYIKPKESKHASSDSDGALPEKLTSHVHEKGLSYYDDVPLPRPRSMRKKHSRSSNGAEVAKESSSSRRRNGSKRGLQILFEDEHQQRDDEERVIDKLLLHYSRKPSNFDQEKLIRKPTNSNEAATNHSTAPTRSTSLPREQTGGKESVKVFARANSFQPDKPASHVHPKLPDYDELAARFAAFKGR
ncbi:uncharacterized protein LOC124927521 [Impatiens glandulifera]|uniref:uncharacterized protein LOC124927521 n=1 Tax=Impatiens glandulifera TaxID=253017 RepID=UPI001FB0F3F5|nr:uncharacterized protein LOC124927521 [Impatiens glandulifera]